MTADEFELLVDSANGGNTDAMYRLGMIYKGGKSYFALNVPKDSAKSLQYFEAAAENGHALAAFRIGVRKDFSFLRVCALAVAALRQFTVRLIGEGLEKVIGLIKILFKSTAWLLAVVFSVGIAYWIFSGIAALPISVAIIVGAVIIAAAISR